MKTSTNIQPLALAPWVLLPVLAAALLCGCAGSSSQPRQFQGPTVPASIGIGRGPGGANSSGGSVFYR